MQLIKLENREESFLRNLYRSYLLHTFFARFLLLEKLALTRDIAAVTFCRYILPYLPHRFAGNDLGADSRLDSDVELLTGDELLELLTHPASEPHGIVGMSESGESVDTLAVEKDVELDKI